MVKLEITSILDPGLEDQSKWVKDCSTCDACDECSAITSTGCGTWVYLCVIIKNNTDAECEVSCNYYLYKGGEKYYSSPTETKKLKPGESAVFFESEIDLIGDLCDDYKASISAWIESCLTSCEISCQETCESSCQSSCEKSCQTTCKSTCQTSCRVSCQETCESICQSTCKVSCQETCKTSCQTICESSCQSTCESTCEETCEKSCEEACEKGQELICAENCEIFCQISCKKSCQSVCEATCKETCEETCQLLEEVKCPIMVVSYGTPLVDCLEPLRRIRRILPSLILRIYYSDLHLKIARKLRRFLYLPLLILVKFINYISKQH